MNKALKMNIFFYLSVILAIGNVYLFSNSLNKKEVIAGLEAQIQDLESTIETMAEEEQELAGLKAVCPIQREGSEGEIYLFHYFVRDEWEIDDGNYCAIGIDYQSNSSG